MALSRLGYRGMHVLRPGESNSALLGFLGARRLRLALAFHRSDGQLASEPAKICQASTDFATRLSTK